MKACCLSHSKGSPEVETLPCFGFFTRVLAENADLVRFALCFETALPISSQWCSHTHTNHIFWAALLLYHKIDNILMLFTHLTQHVVVAIFALFLDEKFFALRMYVHIYTFQVWVDSFRMHIVPNAWKACQHCKHSKFNKKPSGAHKILQQNIWWVWNDRSILKDSSKYNAFWSTFYSCYVFM